MDVEFDEHIKGCMKLIAGTDYTEQCLPSDLAKHFAESNSGMHDLSLVDFQAINPQLILPVKYYMGQNSKFMRTLVTLSIGKIVSVEDVQTLLAIAEAIELFHNASLVIDDIQDRAETRRDQPSAHIKYGLDNAINSGCFCYFLGIEKLLSKLRPLVSSDKQVKIYEAVTHMFIKGHIGNAFDLRTHAFVDPLFKYSLKEYETFLMLKTSALILLSIQIIAIIFDIDPKLSKPLENALELFCLGFQILNDVISLDPANSKFGDDITEKKISFPMILFLTREASDQSKAKFFEIINSEAVTRNQMLEFRSLIAQSIDESMVYVEQLTSQMREIVSLEIFEGKNAGMVLKLFELIRKKMFNP